MTPKAGHTFTAGPCEIPLSKGSITIIDRDDLPMVDGKKWRKDNGYAVHSFRCPDGKVQSIRMHRLIMDAPAELEVDHINGNRLDNRRSNLRLCSSKQNNQNRPKHKTGGNRPYKGVRKRNNRYVAEIRINGANIALGSFLAAEDAAFAYDCAAKKHFGEFANLNGVSGNPSPRVLQEQAIASLAETGLTPRQLVERCKKLEGALRELQPTLLADHGCKGGLSETTRKRAYAIVSAALSKATAGGAV